MSVKLASLHIPEKPPGLLDKYSWVYMMCSKSRRALYTGICTGLHKRVFEHKNGLIEGFTKKYKCHRLVYFETFAYVGQAIKREKEIKGWRREKKDALVETINPQWKDLAENWYPKTLKHTQKSVHMILVSKSNRKVPPHQHAPLADVSG